MIKRELQERFNPKENYAIASAKIVTINRGRRIVKYYKSGERLDGKIIERKDYML